jgi:hypothetical protein
MRPPATTLPRRTLLRLAAAAAAAVTIPWPLAALPADPDIARLMDWVERLRADGLAAKEAPLGRSAARVGELAAGTPYEPGTLEAYLRDGGDPMGVEPLALSLTRFDCVTLVESCLAVARIATDPHKGMWERFGHEVERMRYRCGVRQGYASRLHYFSEWISDGAKRGLVRDLGAELGGVHDSRPLRFMSEHRGSYPALAHDSAFAEIAAMEHELDGQPRLVVPRERLPEMASGIDTGDVLAFATEIPGLDVTHAAFAYRDAAGILRVLHTPLSGGVVEVTRATLPEYVAAIRRCTGVLVARPLPA